MFGINKKSSEIKKLLSLQEEALRQIKQQSHNILVLYRRTTVLAHMLESIAKHNDMRIPKTIRAEIDASLRPEEFASLARQDEAEFVARYGESTLAVIKEQGLQAISTIGDLADTPPKHKLQ